MERASVLLLSVFLLAVISNVFANSCTDICDAKNQKSSLYSGNVTFCGTDYQTYNTFRAAINDFTSPGCYGASCNIGVLYPGTCECPNFCSAELGRGTCDTVAHKCACASGWGGKDCSQVVCSSNNTCSGHGTCSTQPASKGGDRCVCANGWTSADCSVYVPSGLTSRIPFGEVLPGPYYMNDKYGDDHPVINISLVASIRIKIAPADLVYILSPANAYNQTEVSANFYFSNSYTSETINDITMKIHGSLSRVFNKKSFNFKFGKGNSIKKLKGLNLKASNFDRIVSQQLMGDFDRAMQVQTYRMGVTELWVNEVFYGMYTMMEKFDENFQESRHNVTDTDMYKIALFDGQNLGTSPTPYQELRTVIYTTPQVSIEKEEGNDTDWTHFVDFIQAINSPSASVRADYLNNHFDVTTFLRAMAVEAITLDFDAYSGTGNNWVLTDRSSNNSPVYSWVAFDYDSPIDGLNIFQESIAKQLFNITAIQLNQLIEAGYVTLPGLLGDYFPSQNPYKFVNRPSHPKPLLLAVFGLPGSNTTYTNNIKAFLRAVYVERRGVLLQRFLDFYSLTRSGISRDQFYRLDGSSVSLFDYAVSKTLALLDTRFTYLSQLMFPACNANTTCNGNGVCTLAGECVCNTGFTGASCNQCVANRYGPKCVECGNTVTFAQTQTGSWTDASGPVTMWNVVLQVGAQPLYSSQIRVSASAGNTIQSIWNADQAGSGVYDVPDWVYQNGVIPANTQSYSFGYITSGTQKAAISLVDNPCVPSADCQISLSPVKSASWQSSNTLYQQYYLSVTATNRTLANVQVKITVTAGSSITDQYNMALQSSNNGAYVYTCSTWNLPAGSTSSGCGYTIKTPNGSNQNSYATVSVVQPICL